MKKVLITLSLLMFATTSYAASLTITVPNDQVQRVLDAYGYKTEICEIVDEVETCVANPMTPTRYMQQEMVNHIKRTVRIYEKRAAVQALVIEDVDATEE